MCTYAPVCFHMWLCMHAQPSRALLHRPCMHSSCAMSAPATYVHGARARAHALTHALTHALAHTRTHARTDSTTGGRFFAPQFQAAATWNMLEENKLYIDWVWEARTRAHTHTHARTHRLSPLLSLTHSRAHARAHTRARTHTHTGWIRAVRTDHDVQLASCS